MFVTDKKQPNYMLISRLQSSKSPLIKFKRNQFLGTREQKRKDKDLNKFRWIEPPPFSQAGSFVGDSLNQASIVKGHMQRLRDNSMEKINVAVSPL